MNEGDEPTGSRPDPDATNSRSLGAALDRALAATGSALRSASHRHTGYADVWFGSRSAHVNRVVNESPFSLGFCEHHGEQVSMARGRAAELSEAAKAIRTVLENGEQKVSDLIRAFPFLEMAPFGLSWERGTYVEDHWAELLKVGPYYDRRAVDQPVQNELFHWDDVAELIRRASERPELRRLMPFTSLHRFSVRSPTGGGVPLIWPLGDGRYELTAPSEGSSLAEGSAAVVLDALIDYVVPPEDA